MKSFAQVELSCCHHCDRLRPGPIADANESLRTATMLQFAELNPECFRDTDRVWAKRVQLLNEGPAHAPMHLTEEKQVRTACAALRCCKTLL
ncbi:MAG: phosphomethylpyrimidine synthase ThiC [Verrucomicrobia bacterium]|nr:phosphomethylpyrimidine synthase ThiC [Verrucomicrobiota bacterium]